MAERSANQDILPYAANIYAEAAGYYRDRASPDDKERYRRRVSEIDAELARDADRFTQQRQILEAELKKYSPNQDLIFKTVRDLVDRGMDMGEKRSEFQALSAITDSSKGDGVRRAEQALNGGDMFANADIPPHLRQWFRTEILDRVVNEEFAKRQLTSNDEQRRAAEEIRSVELGKIVERERQICFYEEAIKLHQRHDMGRAREEQGIVDGLKRDNAREAKRLFENYVVSGARNHGQSAVWNTLQARPTIGIQPRPVVVEQPVVAAPATPAPIPAVTVPAPAPTVAAPAADPTNPSVATMGAAIDGPATGGAPATTAPVTPPVVTAPVVPVAPPVVETPVDVTPTPVRDPYFHVLLPKLGEDARIRPQTAADVLNAMGSAYSDGYDPAIANPKILPFLKNNFGLDPETVVDIDDVETMKKLAQTAFLYATFSGDVAKMQESLNLANTNPSSPDGLAKAAVDEMITKAIEIKKTQDAGFTQGENFTPDAGQQSEQSSDNNTVLYAAAAATAVAVGLALKKRFSAEKKLKRDQDALEKEKANIDAETQSLLERERIAAERRTELETLKATEDYKKLSDEEKAKRESDVKALEDEAREARAKHNERTAAAADAEEDVKARATDIDNQKKGLEMSRKDLDDRLNKARKKIVDAEEKLNKSQRQLDVKRSKDPYGDFTAEENKIEEQRKKLRLALEEHDAYEKSILERRSQHDATGDTKAQDLLAEATRLKDERAAVLAEQERIETARKQNTDAFKKLEDERTALTKKKGSLSPEEYSKQLADIDRRWDENNGKVRTLAAEARAIDIREETLKADRAKLDTAMDDYKKQWRKGKDVVRDVKGNLGEESLLQRARNMFAGDKVVTDVLDAKAPVGVDVEARIASEVKVETGEFRKILADATRELRRQQEIKLVDGVWRDSKGPITDGVYRTEASHQGHINELKVDVEQARILLAGEETALADKKRAAFRVEEARKMGDGRIEPTIGDNLDLGDEEDGKGKGETGEGKKPATESEFYAERERILAEQESALKLKDAELRSRTNAYMQAGRELSEDTKRLRAEKQANPGGDFSVRESELALRRSRHDSTLTALQTDVIAQDNANNEHSKRVDELTKQRTGVDATTQRAQQLEIDRAAHVEALKQHEQARAQLDTDRAQLLGDKAREVHSLVKTDFSGREADIQERTQTLNDAEKGFRARETHFDDVQRTIDLRRPAHIPTETSAGRLGSITAAMNEAASHDVHFKGSKGAALVMGGLGVSHDITSLFSQAGRAEFTDRDTGLLRTGQAGLNLGSAYYGVKEVQIANQAVNASRILAAGTASEEALIAASRTLSGASKASRFFGTPGAIAVGVGMGAIETTIAIKQGDAGRATEATANMVGGTAGAIGGAALGAKGGALAGAAVGVWFGGVGAVPAAAIGGIIGGIGGGLAGWFGGSAAFRKGFEVVGVKGMFEQGMGINDKLRAALTNVNDALLNRLGINKADGISDAELSRVKKELEAKQVTSLRQLDRNRDGNVSAQELTDSLNGSISSGREPVPAARTVGLDNVQAANPFNASSGADNGFGGTTLAGMSWRKDNPIWRA